MLELLMASHIISIRSLPSYCKYDAKYDKVILCTVDNPAKFCFAQRPGCSYYKHHPCVIFVQTGIVRGSRVYNHELDHCRRGVTHP